MKGEKENKHLEKGEGRRNKPDFLLVFRPMTELLGCLTATDPGMWDLGNDG